MNEPTNQKPLSDDLRHTLLMLYSKRLFYPHSRHATIKEFAESLGISISLLSNRLRMLKIKGYIAGSWVDLEFIEINWQELMK